MALLPSLLISSIELCQFAIVTVTVPFYLFLWYFMIKAQFRKFDELATPFFKLCISTAIIDLSTLFANYFGVMFPKFGFFNDFYIYLDAIYAHIYLYIAWSTGICQAMCVSVLATNRLSAMLLPGSYHKMWKSKRLWIAISVQFLPGMLVGLLTFFNKTQLAINEKNGLVPVFLDKQMTTIFFSIGGFFLFANYIYLITAYCFLFIILHKRNAKLNSLSINVSKTKENDRKRERRLFIMCSVIVSVQMTILIFFILKVAKVFELTLDEFYVLYNLLSDLFASINPYLLWIFSDSLRKYVLYQVGLRKHLSVNNTAMITKSAMVNRRPSVAVYN
ncbi:G-protein coupled receptors family 1 profile domain-containing protein [Caenorhabditis elegans]|uniref:G-protein coupled receptors family 1 profile domain-containing protein n=1 Tax=Caenorhabditis elegans TaxID=6239 RepID=Q86DM4_CAEEL|nr:G-protein coupled receptors family 1 profile domain-containing protein [Caenorhabditis elegans]CCD74186.2 G-protein coupled receptors family 1 profile domain-containing protein [Caenorhabditis elegans]|eukprot:NP_872111.2 Serpentine Receptor, class V [Caenorhabditis elegans]